MSIPSTPHMDPQQIAILQDELSRSKCFVEYGAGGSTMLATSMGIEHIISVESSKEYALLVSTEIKNTETKSNLLMNYVDIGKTGAWGRPENRDKSNNWYQYALKPWQVAEDLSLSPDLILVDGRFRVACCAAALLFAKPGTPILFDDYVGRSGSYSPVEKFTGNPLIVAQMAVFKVPEVVNKAALITLLFQYTSNPA